MTDSRPDPDILAEAARLVGGWSTAGTPLRLLGGLAVRMHWRGRPPEPLVRAYHDIDLATVRGGGAAARDFLENMGYEPNQAFNTLNGASRLVYYDLQNGRQIDVFVGEFQMCHRVPVSERLDRDPVSIPLAELLLTKLQIVELNQKDLVDIWSLVYEHDIASTDDDAINADHVAHLLSGDWGLWRTARSTVEQARDELASSGLDEDARRLVAERLDRVWGRVEDEPKSWRWKTRAKLGERSRWWDEPDEIGHRPLDTTVDPGA